MNLADVMYVCIQLSLNYRLHVAVYANEVRPQIVSTSHKKTLLHFTHSEWTYIWNPIICGHIYLFVLFFRYPQEIGDCAALLEKECVALSPQLGALRVLPLHTGLGAATQHVYTADGDDSQAETEEDDKAGPCLRRRVILSDVLGEASFSLPSVRYVIDTGLELKTVSFD